MNLENIIYEKKGHIAVITFNHPPANAWNLAAVTDFLAAVDEAEKDKDVRVVILTGAGEKCFSAGMDVSDAANLPKTSPMAKTLWTRIDRFEKPVIAAINGHALGGGLELALCCTFRIMADNPKAKIGLTELNLGIIPGWGGTQRLSRVVGEAKALDMILFSKRLDANQALEIGLVNQVSAPEMLMEDAMAFAEALAKRPPVAVAMVLRSMSAGAYEGIEKGLEVEGQGSAVVKATKDSQEGFAAFLEKRPPNFIGE
ncbi:enoyl-CoA hydratase [Desulfatibacillum alkenivorans DSM 16219]|jgi:enoyl-CoA hydratase/carnithine racemase|uniref:Enoyl-CoA hydratase n=1 Tax=Desulfatibacillum alkenivorans DSM 16219 TaxID=1121393 RepID=A0A1M6NGU5_9BACT|nr:enoyl-CoA hydratase-related protein [Desulfatibacillum alkenivorans]SHJ94925.1 enoyl-CoA hydratase [Desulfatibacillum alkenivorans DSM 16219]